METVADFELCCGCGMCENICKHNAIIMKKNKQGFFYPIVDKKKCINCKKCTKSCEFNARNLDSLDASVKKAVAVKHINDEIRANSRSGGIFTALSDWVLDKSGVVYGCELVGSMRMR